MRHVVDRSASTETFLKVEKPPKKRRQHGPMDFAQTDLVDPASCHMLVSKIKPCMSLEPKLIELRKAANGSLKQSKTAARSF